MKKKLNNVIIRSHFKATLSIVCCTVIIVCVFLGAVDNLLAKPNDLVQEVGIKTFRMFTVLSGMLMGIASAFCVPFAVDGLRNSNYHLPRWIVGFIYSGTISVSVTFVVALFILSPTAGFVRMMLFESNLYLHTIVPIVSVFSFIFVNSFHRINIKLLFYSSLPVLTYSVVYIISGIILGEENGGWRDHYNFEEYLPWYIALLLIIIITFVLAYLLLIFHNTTHKKEKHIQEEFYRSYGKSANTTINDAIRTLARENKRHYKEGDVVIPSRILALIENEHQSNLPLNELSQVYINEFYNEDSSQKE